MQAINKLVFIASIFLALPALGAEGDHYSIISKTGEFLSIDRINNISLEKRIENGLPLNLIRIELVRKESSNPQIISERSEAVWYEIEMQSREDNILSINADFEGGNLPLFFDLMLSQYSLTMTVDCGESAATFILKIPVSNGALLAEGSFASADLCSKTSGALQTSKF